MKNGLALVARNLPWTLRQSQTYRPLLVETHSPSPGGTFLFRCAPCHRCLTISLSFLMRRSQIRRGARHAKNCLGGFERCAQRKAR